MHIYMYTPTNAHVSMCVQDTFIYTPFIHSHTYKNTYLYIFYLFIDIYIYTYLCIDLYANTDIHEWAYIG